MMLQRPEPELWDGLYNATVRRIRRANTIFGQNVKLVLRVLSEEQIALLGWPYLLVVPTMTRVQAPTRAAQSSDERDTIINPRSMAMIAQLDGRGSEADWMAAVDIELAEKQLIAALVNWRPQPHYHPTLYAGMKVEASRATAVKCSFVFTAYEELGIVADSDEDFCCDDQAGGYVQPLPSASGVSLNITSTPGYMPPVVDYVPEAPKDGKTYGRRNGQWVEIA
jgi:hypothetical protein